MPHSRWITHLLCIGLAATFTNATTCLRLRQCCLRYHNGGKSNHCIECIPGHFGPTCNNTCRYPAYGSLCQLRCVCNVADCNYAVGCRKKDCPSGFQGPYCSKKCRHPSYGIRCQSECLCEEKYCDHITGCSARNIFDDKYVKNDSKKDIFDDKYVKNDSKKDVMNNILPQDQPQLILGITRDSSASILLEKGVSFNCSTMRPYKITSSELRTMVTSLLVLAVAFLLIMWIYHKLNTRQQETFHWVAC